MQAVSSPEFNTSASNADRSTSSSADEPTLGEIYTAPPSTRQQQMSMVTDTPHPIGQAYSGAQKQPAAVRLSSVLFSGTYQSLRPDTGPKTPILSAPDLRPGIRQRIQQVAEQSIICIRGTSQGYAAAPAPATAASMQPITSVRAAAYLLPGSKARLRTQWPSVRSASAVPQPLTQPLPASARPAKPQQPSLAAKMPRPSPSRPVQCRPMPRLLVKAVLRLMLADCLEPTAGMLYITRRFQALRGEAVIMSGLSLGLEVAQQATNPSQIPALTPPMLNSFLWFLAQRRPSPEAVAAQLSSEQQAAAAQDPACQPPTSPSHAAACAPAGSLHQA